MGTQFLLLASVGNLQAAETIVHIVSSNSLYIRHWYAKA